MSIHERIVEALDVLGRFLLGFTHYVIVGAATLLLLGLYVVVSLRRGARPDVSEAAAVVTAALCMFGGTAVVCALVLTTPPALELMGKSNQQLAGLLGGIALFALAWREFARVFLPARVPELNRPDGPATDAQGELPSSSE